ncbi:hypothetical protein Rhe02_54850 [Rhizocola hellebori]|uniref:Uncharacterized protein n=1 Tax=Rhizocola hellebori TaxID=1392758 RepID=A0A8J3QCY7_9ACTN|nr:hypothetical protein [Rhizocola hellebori]GIH07418.1 hypothetical protein Rhe02_54850 [Rhizocola hellebori]
MQGVSTPSGSLSIQHIRGGDPVRDQFDGIVGRSLWPAKELTVAEIAHYGLPRKGLDERVNAWRTANWRNLFRGARKALTARALRLSNMYGSLYISHIKADGEVLDLGLASMRVVTTAGVNFLVDALQGSVEPEILRYHGVGTGSNAEASGDTALQTESTTILTVDSTRATGSLTEGASANIFRSVGTISFDGSGAIVEHGLFSQAATGGGTLLDRSVFSAINVVSGDSLVVTFDLTLPAGS